MLFHELGKSLVAHRQLAFESGQFTLGFPNTSGRGPSAFKGSGSLFEKGFLPLVKECRRDAVLVAEVADGCALDKVLARDVHFLFRGVVATGCFHCRAHSVADPSGVSISV